MLDSRDTVDLEAKCQRVGIDLSEIRKWDVLFGHGLVEVRIPNVKTKCRPSTFSGYFPSAEAALPEVVQYAENNNIYCTLNVLDDGLNAREPQNHLDKSAITTTDSEIRRRYVILIDVDPTRPKDTSATDSQKEAAESVAGKILVFLKENKFFHPVIADSGNGYHIYLRVDMGTSSEENRIVSSFLDMLDKKFSTEAASVDRSVSNLSRICKLIGTTARKGINTPERPHRMASFIYIPEGWKTNINDISRFQAVIPEEAPRSRPLPSSSSAVTYHTQRDQVDFAIRKLDQWGVRHAEPEMRTNPGFEGNIKIALTEGCLFDPSHKDAAIFVQNDGKIVYHCFHNSCQDKTWPQVREMFEPEYRSRRFQQMAYNMPDIDDFQDLDVAPPEEQANPNEASEELQELRDSLPQDEEFADSELRLLAQLRQDEFHIGDEYQDLQPLLEIGGVQVMPRGNLFVVKGKNGKGKSHLMNLFIGKLLSHPQGCNESSRKDYVDRFPDIQPTVFAMGLKILFIDTEQTMPDLRVNWHEVERNANISREEIEQRTNVFSLRKYTSQEALDATMVLIKSIHPDITIIDVITDLGEAGINNELESGKLGRSFLKYADEMNMTFIFVLHQNEGGDDNSKATGWIGTWLENKAYDIWTVTSTKKETIDDQTEQVVQISTYTAEHTKHRRWTAQPIIWQFDKSGHMFGNGVKEALAKAKEEKATRESERKKEEKRNNLKDLLSEMNLPTGDYAAIDLQKKMHEVEERNNGKHNNGRVNTVASYLRWVRTACEMRLLPQYETGLYHYTNLNYQNNNVEEDADND